MKNAKLAKTGFKVICAHQVKKVVQLAAIKGIKLKRMKNIQIWVIIKYQAQSFKIPFLVASCTTKK